MTALSELAQLFASVCLFVLRPASRLSPMYLVAMVAIAFPLYLRTSRSTSFVQWAFPKSMYLHKSHRTDIKLFGIGQALTFVGFFKLTAVSTLTATAVVNGLGGSITGETRLGAIPVTILLVLTLDFAVYWVHRLHHETPALWPFHSVHHSAEVMTPVTVYRKHPIYDILSTLTKGLFAGLLQGLLLGLVVGQVDIATIASVNAGYFLFNIFGSNLRHTHLWLSYGRVLEHIIISPAQHQIHHSVEKRHFNKNYGEIFAFWDWAFGTLYVPESREQLQFGLSDAEGNPVAQPHDGLRQALLIPLKDSWNSLRPRHSAPAQPTRETQPTRQAQSETPAPITPKSEVAAK